MIVLVIHSFHLIACTNKVRQESSDEESARSFFYEDHKVFFTMMVYFPFVVNTWSYGVPSAGGGIFKEAADEDGSLEQVVVEGSETIEAEDEKTNQVLEFSKRALDTDAFERATRTNTTSRSRQKRTLYMDDQTINLFLCISLPFSVPLLQYDEDLHQAHKNKNARVEFEKKLPQIEPHENEFRLAKKKPTDGPPIEAHPDNQDPPLIK